MPRVGDAERVSAFDILKHGYPGMESGSGHRNLDR